MKDIALAGPAGVGKDTVAQILVRDHGYKRLAFADELKRVLMEVNPTVGMGGLREMVEALGWEEAKVHTEVRRLLQEFGMAMRGVDERIWIRALDEIIRWVDADTPVVITDVRMPNELAYAKTIGLFTVHLDRPGVRTDAGWRKHPSETGLDGLLDEFDLTFNGDWTAHSVVDELLEHMNKSTVPSAPALNGRLR